MDTARPSDTSIDTPTDIASDAGVRWERASSFGRGAVAYARSRPDYPDDVVRWLLPPGAERVLDLAAGTGKLTQRLVAAGADVVAVEPSEGMREQLHEAAPQAQALAGTADAIPLDDADVDAVLVAQAWHWFDPRTALPEIARVLRPGGRVGVVWNVRDHTVDWVRSFTEIVHRGDSLSPNHGDPGFETVPGLFGPTEHATFPWAHRIAVGELRTLAASRSHLLTLDPAAREALLDEIDHLVATHPDLAGRTEVDLPYRAEAWRADLA